MKVSLEMDIKGLDRDLAAVVADRGLHAKAALRATNETGRTARTRVGKAVRTELNISAKSMNKRLKFYGATFKKPSARLWAGTKIGVPAYEGGTRNKGVFATAPTRAFEAQMKSGHKGLFYRSWANGAPRTTKESLPISEVRVPTYPAVNRLMPGIAESVWNEKFTIVYQRDLDWRLRKRGWR